MESEFKNQSAKLAGQNVNRTILLPLQELETVFTQLLYHKVHDPRWEGGTWLAAGGGFTMKIKLVCDCIKLHYFVHEIQFLNFAVLKKMSFDWDNFELENIFSLWCQQSWFQWVSSYFQHDNVCQYVPAEGGGGGGENPGPVNCVILLFYCHEETIK